MKLHILKIKEEYFHAILDGVKTFELRKNDRNYQVGDLIHFKDVEGEEFNYCFFSSDDEYAEKIVFQITYVLKNVPEYGLDKDYCILGIKYLREE